MHLKDFSLFNNKDIPGRQKKLSIPFLWLVILGDVLILASLVWFQARSLPVEIEQMRLALQSAYSSRSRILAQNIRQATLDENWQVVGAQLSQVSSKSTAETAFLVCPDGSVVAAGQPTLNFDYFRLPLDVNNPPYPTHLNWLPGSSILQMIVPVLDQDQAVKAFLVTSSDFQESFNPLLASYRSNLESLVLFNLLFLAIIIVLYTLFLQRPLLRLLKLTQPAHSSAYFKNSSASPESAPLEHASDSLVSEVRYISKVFDLFVRRIAVQRQAIDSINQKMSAVIAENKDKQEINRTRQRIHRLETLNTAIVTTSAVLELPALIRSTLDQLLHIMDLSKGMIWVDQACAARRISDEARLKLDQAIQAHPLQFSRKMAISDWQDAPAYLDDLAHSMAQEEILSSLTLPVFCGGNITGAIHLASSDRRAWLPEETAALEIIAHQIGFSNERAQFIQDIQVQNQMMKTLVSQSEILNHPFTPSSVLDAIGRGALDLSKADSLAILVRQPDQEMTCPWSYQLSNALIDSALAVSSVKFTSLLTPDLLFIEEACNEAGNITILAKAREEGLSSVFIWPLIYEGQANVYVCCFYKTETQLKQNEREVMEAFFRQAAAALENTRLFVAESSQRHLAEALREITVTLASTLDLDEVLEGILDQLSRVIPHDFSDIMILDHDMIEVMRNRGYPQEIHSDLRKLKYPLESMHSLLEMKETGRAVVIPNIAAYPDWTDFPFSQWMKSYAGAPMLHRGEVFGFINVASQQTNFFQPETGPILQIFASQAAIFIENARLYQATQRRVEETDALYRATLPLFNTNEDMVALSRQITESVTQEFASAHCSVLLINEKRTHLSIVAQSGYPQTGSYDLEMEGPGLTVASAKNRKIIYSPDVQQDALFVQGAPETRSELVIPLTVRDHTLGVLNLESPEVNAFDEQAQRVLSSYAERASLGLENARLFDAIRRNAEQMQQLNQITRAALQTTDADDLLNQLTSFVARMIHADGCYITFWDENNQRTIPHAAFGPRQDIYASIVPALGETTLTESALKLNQTLIVEDIFSTPHVSPRLASTFACRSVLALPLVSDEKKLGAVLVGFIEHHIFSADEIALSEQAAGQIALALTRQRSLELAQRRAYEAETLRQASLALTSSLELQQVLDRILNYLEQVLPFDSACVFLKAGDSLSVGAVKNLAKTEEVFQTRLISEDELTLEIQRTLRPLILSDAQADPRFKHWGGNGYVRGWLGVPLISGGAILGILTLDRQETSFTQEESSLAQGFANHAAVAVQNAQLHSAVQHLAITDSMTEVYNRRGFFALANKILASVQRSKRPLSALMIDVDFFKLVNDRYGHDIGDVVLQTLTSRCKKIMREADLICRYGGEEFVILLPDSDQTGAQIAAQRLYANIVGTPIATEAGPVSITISIGVATMDDQTTTLETLLKCTDLALYKAKQEGRNRISTWPTPQK